MAITLKNLSIVFVCEMCTDKDMHAAEAMGQDRVRHEQDHPVLYI